MEWYRKVKNHLKGSHKDLQAILEYVEGRREEITKEDLARNLGLMIDLDCRQLSCAIYHMLNGLLTGEAHKELSDHESVQGLEVWRALTVNLTDKGPHKRSALLERLNQPPRARTMAGVRAILKEWEKFLREYHAAGGSEYQTDKFNILMLRRMLPQDEKRKLTHREFVEGAMGTAGETYDVMRQRVVDTISREEIEVQAREGNILTAEGPNEQIYNGTQAEVNDEPDGETMDEEEFQSLMVAVDSGALSSEQILAIHRKIQRKGRCFNCGRPGHIAKNCKSPKKAPGQFRKGFNPAAGKTCHNCKEVGHFARDCPKTGGGGGRQQGQDRGQYRGGARPFGRPQGGGGQGGGGRPPTWRPRGGQIHNTEATTERQLFQFMMEEIRHDDDKTTTMIDLDHLSPITATRVRFNDHPCCAAPSPRTGAAGCSHIRGRPCPGESPRCLSPTPPKTSDPRHGNNVIPVASTPAGGRRGH
jgi:hypothetical protein